MGARHGSGNKCALDEQDPSLMPFNTLHTIMLHAIKVSLEWCAIYELGLKVSELFDVIIIKSASHHSAPSIYLHAVNLIIIGSSIIFKHGGYQQCRITVVSPCAGYPYQFPKGYLDHSCIGFMACTLSSPRHGACAYPTLTSDDKKHSTRKFGFETDGS